MMNRVKGKLLIAFSVAALLTYNADSVVAVTSTENARTSSSFAGASTDAMSIISGLDARMVSLDSMIYHTTNPFATPEFLEWKVDVPVDQDYSDRVDAVRDARISTIKAQTGIQLTGQTYYRPDAMFGIDEDEAELSRYVGKIQVEARWYFLQSGLLKRKSRMEEISLKADIDKWEHERDRTAPGLFACREHLRTVSDSILASVMLHRVDNLEMLQNAYMYLLGNENISSDNMLRILDDLADAKRRLSTIVSPQVRTSCLSSVAAGTITVDTLAVLSALTDTNVDLKILGLKQQLMDKQADNTTWWSDVRIAPFVRYSQYFRHEYRTSANVDMGVSFTIPVNAEAAKQRKVIRAEKDLLEMERADMVAAAADRVRYLAHEIERLNNSVSGEWERAASLRKYLKMRRHAYTEREGEYNRLSALMEYNTYLRCLESIIEIQYRRDILVADLQALVPVVPLLQYCTFTPLGIAPEGVEN